MLCEMREEETGLYSGGGASDSTSLDVLMGFDESQLLKGSRMLPRGGRIGVSTNSSIYNT